MVVEVVTPPVDQAVTPAAVTPVVTPPAPVLGADPAAPAVDKPATPAAEPAAWKEYVADPAKSEADNTAAKAEHDKTKPAEKPAVGAPEKYEAFTLPEGFESDPVALEEFNGVAKELNLNQAQAQRLVDMQAKVMTQVAEKQMQLWADTNAKWVADAKTDKEIGGDKFDETVAAGNQFIKTFGTPELVKALATTGAGNHPEFIRLCARAQRAISEDKIVAGNPAGAKTKPEDRIFNHPTS